MNDFELLETLTATLALAGHEDAMVSVMKRLLEPFANKISVDLLGNVMVRVGQPVSENAKKVMIFAHSDELGFVVKRIEQNGFLRLERLGGVPEKSMSGQSVVIKTKKGTFNGLIGTKSHHVTPQNEKYDVKPISQVYADFGFKNKEEVLEAGIDIGTPVGYQRQFFRNGDFVFSNALDNRAGCWTLVKLAEKLADISTPCEVWIVVSVQEEFSLRGVLPAARVINPDIAVAIDIAIAHDTPDLAEQGDVALGNGPTLGLYSFHGRGTLAGVIPNPKLVEYTEQVARKEKIPLQKYVFMGGLTDSSFLQLLGKGVPSIDIGFPLRYSHAPVEEIHMKDLQQLVRLLEAFVFEMPNQLDLERGLDIE